MKYALIAAGVLSALSLTVKADDTKPEFTVYGLLHLSVDYLKYTDPGASSSSSLDDKSESNFAVSSNSSRIGVKGEYRLDEDWTITYLSEWQIGATEESKSSANGPVNNNLSRRPQWLGLRTSWGEWRAGFMDSPLRNLRAKVDLFYSDQLGESRTITNASGFDGRLNNAVQLDIGTGQIHGLIVYSADRGSDAVDDNNNSAASGVVFWENQQWFVGGGVEQRKYAIGDISDSSKKNTLAARFALSAKFGSELANKLAFFIENVANVNGTDGLDRTTIGTGYSYKFGDNILKAAYYKAGRLSSYDNNGQLVAESPTGASQFSLGWDRLYGKNTVLYLALAHMSNEDLAAFKVVGVGHDGEIATVPGKSNKGVSVGIRHGF